MEQKYVIIDLRTMEPFLTMDDKVKIFDTLEEACTTCGMYELENAWVMQLIYNHIEPPYDNQSTSTMSSSDELDCPFDFTSRCTMGRCDCRPKSFLIL